MKWRTKPDWMPRHGDKKTVKRFALLPMVMDDGYTVWLEWYIAYKQYFNGYAGGSWDTYKRESI